MSEEILKALTQLFAIITKQDGGVTEAERDYVISFFESELDQDSKQEYIDLYDKFIGENKRAKKRQLADGEVEAKPAKRRLTPVNDSVKTLGICRKINKTLTQKQKTIVLVKLFELVAADDNFTDNRMEIINTVSESFNIPDEEYQAVDNFIRRKNDNLLSRNMLVVGARNKYAENITFINAHIKGEVRFVHLPSVDTYFVQYDGDENVTLNGNFLKRNSIHFFTHGSAVKIADGTVLYYSEIVRHFFNNQNNIALSFNVKGVNYRFKNGGVGLRDINISEGPGKLIGIMGGSGAGKTTLLNVLSGIEKPSTGTISINGIDINQESENELLNGVIGYVSQDDLLIEELTVYENLYYNAKLCFSDLSEKQIEEKVLNLLDSLGLDQRKDLRVGSVFDKTISGGQRKRLNIALELIREPSVLFVDEPTSGLSSRDSENVMDLLKELSQKGKLVFVVIHQPSSDIYKIFDKMVIMDNGGYMIYYGNPIEAVEYFRVETKQVDANSAARCITCGNVNSEQIFNNVERKVVDEFGQFTNKRKISPSQWHDKFKQNFAISWVKDEEELPVSTLNKPSKWKQMLIFAKRDMLAKLSNKQYLLINLLQAPLLASILAFIIRYKNDTDSSGYIYRFNENIPVYIMMCVIVAFFMGLTVSAEEIIRDRKILKREAFLNLSWNSYLVSKLTLLFSLSAIQTLAFVLVGDTILEVKGMYFYHWLILFSVSCFANVIGLNISSAFNSAITVYILIPLLIIPQMILSGLLFSFDKLNEVISNKGKVPLVADAMVSRWAYEAIAVKEYMANDFEKPFFKFEKEARQADFKASFYYKELKRVVSDIEELAEDKEKNQERLVELFALLKRELGNENFKTSFNKGALMSKINLESYSKESVALINTYLEEMRNFYLDKYKLEEVKKEKLIHYFEKNPSYSLSELKDTHFNESLNDLLRNLSVKDRIIEYEGQLFQQIDPIFNVPTLDKSLLDYRTHFFAPYKHFLGKLWDTYYFNLFVIWSMFLFLYVTLYFELLKKVIDFFSKLDKK
ncbi:ATP-binding cassette domain-containing protein [Aureibacter tunicatorum]|uniref:ABC-type multidrug transport system ATPase subunit n=1 Tax=Aureibacter tunicatorum TaxID=866807 RepID=A0AAE3XN64_9BACT|nr:ATP-binding cassette domain-containing protein [Aureibacter tunicatorum]MDR6239033.1 ABC-type multidrug transport system ATPase subunit [Aureibacter tunicatorum]BDD05041.1 hypothetical protein AUTU_25240 [Aureibacter tunicatorum]